MSELIICPNCGIGVELTDALSAQLREQLRKQFETEARRKEQEYAGRDEELRKKESALAEARRALEQEIEGRVQKEQQRLAAVAREQAQQSVGVELQDLQERLAETQTKLGSVPKLLFAVIP